MNKRAHDFRHDAVVPLGFSYIPPQVEQLAWREREIASIVYRFGYATAKDVEAELSQSVSNGAVRSMLVRLVRKGILRRRPGKRGAGCADVFIAALSIDHARTRALAKLADDFFGGSLFELEDYVVGMCGRSG
ncbi:MAG TPA: BlaI/MecI/CopY family transcriptional regulator [Sphingomicrobium sp.]|jgi:predicted transcriptional regulator|nr:BlaI/MecI/CopY family transcriptional regulator [Sphingomicrobium sp.]